MRKVGLSKRKRVSVDTSKCAEDGPWHSTAIGEVEFQVETPATSANEDASSAKKRPTSPLMKPPETPIKRLNLQQILHNTPCTPGSGNRNITDPVVITAPSGHAFFGTILQKYGFILAQPRNHIRK